MSSNWPCQINGDIKVTDLHVGHGVVIEEGVVLRGRKMIFGDFAFVGNGTKILCDQFRMGDYSKINAYSFCHGNEPLTIGHNCWIGGNVVLDSTGGLAIGNGVGIGSGWRILRWRFRFWVRNRTATTASAHRAAR